MLTLADPHFGQLAWYRLIFIVSEIKHDLEWSFQNMQRSRTQTVAISGQIIWLNLLVAARSIRRNVGSRMSKKGSILSSFPTSGVDASSFSSFPESNSSDAKLEHDPARVKTEYYVETAAWLAKAWCIHKQQLPVTDYDGKTSVGRAVFEAFITSRSNPRPRKETPTVLGILSAATALLTADATYSLYELVLYILAFIIIVLIFLYIAYERPGEAAKEAEKDKDRPKEK